VVTWSPWVHDARMDRIPIGGHPSQDPDNVVPLHGPPSDPGAPGREADDAVSYEEALKADAETGAEPDEQEEQPRIPGSGVAGLLEQGIRVGAGLFSAGASALADALRETIPKQPAEESDPAAVAAGAGLGAAVVATEAAATAATRAADAIAPLVSWAINPRFAKDAVEAGAGAARVLDGEWKAAQAETAKAASRFIGVLVPEIVDALFDQVDLTQLVRDRVNVDAIVDDVDLDRILARIDMNAIIDRVDVDAIVTKVDMERVARTFPVEGVVDRLDVDRVVDRVDVERVVERVDVDGIVRRLDLAEIAQEVVDEIDLPRIIRESSGAMASETVQTVRVQGMNADRLVSRIVDRVIRREARDLRPSSHGREPT
jgi:hypothetical protein